MARKKKKKIEPLVVSYYVEPTPITRNYMDLKLSRLKPSMIMSGVVTKIKIRNQELCIECSGTENDSWICLINILLRTIYVNNPSSFLKVIFNNGLLSEHFQITSVKPVYIDGSKEIEENEVYSVVNKQFYMIIKKKMKWLYLVTAIQTLFGIIEGDTKDIRLDILKQQ